MTLPCRLALAGAGAWGQNLLRLACTSPRASLVAVIDPDQRAREQAVARAASLAPGLTIRTFPTLEAALSADALRLDALLIASPARTHAALAQRALEAGLDVLVEKPLTTSAAEAAGLVELARRRERVAMVGHLLRYHPAICRLLDEVRRGTVGRLRSLRSSRRSPPGRPSDVDALWALGPHDVSLLLALDPSPLASISATLSGDEAEVQARTASGLAVHFSLSRAHPAKERRLVVLGHEAALLFDDLRPDAPLTLHRVTAGLIDPQAEPLPTAQGEPLALEFAHFLDCVVTRSPPLTPLADGLRVVRWLEAADASAGPQKRPASPSDPAPT